MTEIKPDFNETDLQAILEALLFVSPGPVSAAQLAVFLGKTSAEIELALKALDESCNEKRGITLQWHAGKVQLTSAPRYGELVENFLGLEATTHLSRAALEALAIVAYQQPVTRPQIDAIRGVSSDGVLKSLLSKGLIEEEGRTEGPGRPIMYGTSADFMQYFGLTSLKQLPPLETLVESSEIEHEKKEFLKE